MKIVPFLRYLSKSVHQEHNNEQDDDQNATSTGFHRSRGTSSSGASCTTSISLTVWRKSLVISCTGFTVIDSNGDLVYRVDNYVEHPKELTLMDANGKFVLSMCRNKKLSLEERWFVYEGEEKGWPIFSVKKNKSLFLNAKSSSVIGYVYREDYGSRRRCEYVIEGCYKNRSCKVAEELSRNVVAEIKRKEANVDGVSYGVEVFHLVVHPGFHPGFAMALVMLLDKMF